MAAKNGFRMAPVIVLQAPCPPGMDQSVRALLQEHAGLRRLCDRLEATADALPRLPPPQARQDLALALGKLAQHQAREEAVLRQLLPLRGAGGLATRLLAQIAGQHALDQIHAQDLGGALTAPGMAEAPVLALAYMLRCFFDGCRRAMAFEELVILTLARGRLSAETTELLTRPPRPG